MNRPSLKFDPFDSEVCRNPYPFYDRLRSENPVHWSVVGSWVLTRHDDVRHALRHPDLRTVDTPERIRHRSRLLERKGRTLDHLLRLTRLSFFFVDPPEHTRLRKLVVPSFTPDKISRLESGVHEIVGRILDQLEEGAPIDLVHSFAAPLSARVIGRMMRIPEDETDRIHAWTRALTPVLDSLIPLEQYDRMNEVAEEALNYFTRLIERRRDRPGSDLISELATRAESLTPPMPPEELAAVCIFLFLAAEETTVKGIGNGVLSLLRYPEQLDLLRRDAGLVESAVAELLRFESPAQFTGREAVRDLEIRGVPIREGQRVLPYLGAANRDPAVFEDPHRLDITRDARQHIAFGDGAHRCLGFFLATMEMKVALGSLLERFPSITLETEEPEWIPHTFLRGLIALPVSLSR